MITFETLAASRRQWIDDVLKPWCQQVPHKELKKAELEWDNIAGSVDPEATLWSWAWTRFPALVYDGFNGVNETCEVTVFLTDGSQLTGYPDGRQSKQGMLFLLCDGGAQEEGPHSIDVIARVEKA